MEKCCTRPWHTWRRFVAWLVSVCLALVPLSARADLRTPAWYDQNAAGSVPDWHYRVPVTVPAGASVNSTVRVDVNFNALLTQLGVSGTFDVNSPRVVRPNGTLAAAQEFTDAVFAGATDATGDGKGEVRFLLEDAGPATYFVYFDITQNGSKPANPQPPINGNFEQSAVAGTQNPPGWTAVKAAGGATYDAQVRPSENLPITTDGALVGNATGDGALPGRTTNGTPNTGGFSYLIGARSANEVAVTNPAVTLSRTIVVPASSPGNLVIRYRVEGWDAGANASTNYDFLRIAVVGSVTTEIVGPTAGNYTTFPFSPNLGANQASGTASGYGQYNGWDTDTAGTHRSGMTVARGAEPWWTRTFDLTPFAGQTVTLRFTSSHATQYRSWFHIDDVEWSVVSGTLGTPQGFGANLILPNDTAAGAASAYVAGNRLVIRARVDAIPAAATNPVTADVIDQNGTAVAAGVRLYNDGTHGDAVAGDNIWTNDGSVPADPTYTFLASDPAGTNWLVRVFARDGSSSTIGSANGLIRIPGQPNSPATQANFYNIDEQVFTFSGPPTMTKVSAVISDPVNGVTNPKRIPGAIIEYTLLITNPGIAMTSNSVVMIDALDPNTSLVVTDIAGAGSGPVAFAQGTVASGLTYTFTNAASATDDVEFFNATSGGARITTLTPNALGCDASVRRIEINPKGVFADGTAVGTDPSFTLRFRVCIR